MTDHITLPRSVVEQLKHALENANAFSPCPMYREALIISRDALAAEQAEPVAIRWRWPGYRWTYEDYKPDQFYAPRVEKQKLYTAPQPAQQAEPADDKPHFTLDDADLHDLLNVTAHMLLHGGNQDTAMEWAMCLAKVEARLKPAQPVVVVPQGWKLVPVEPTDAMAIAASKVSLRNPAINGLPQYRAMLAAAPTPPAATVPVLEPLTDAEIQDVIDESHKTFRAWSRGIRGQMFMPQDDVKWHLIRAVEAAHNAKLAKLNGITQPAKGGV